jgi:outer membrane receptor for ferrienterochelin and colicins
LIRKRSARRLFARHALPLLLIVVATTTARAQESDLFGQKSSYFRDDVVQGASKHPEAATEAPATVTVLTSEDIRAYGFRTVADVLNFASVGSFTHNDRRYDFAGSRGLFFFEDFNTRILVLLNGHPLNEPWNNFGGVGREMLVPLEIAKSVEIVYGPSSLLYGGYSLYGVVNVVTETGGSLAGTRVLLRGGSEAQKEILVSDGREGVAGANATRWSFLGAIGAYDSNGENLNLPLVPESGFGGSQSGTDAERSPFGFGFARYGEFTFMARAGYRRHGAPMAPYESTYGSTLEYVRDDKSFIEGSWEHEIAPETTLTVRTFYDWYSYTEHDPYEADDTVAAPYLFVLRADDSDFGGEVRLNTHRGAHFLTGGLEYRKRAIYQRSFFQYSETGQQVEDSFFGDHINGSLFVAYAQEEFRPSMHWSFVGGATLARTEPGGEKVQPRIAAIYKPNPDLAIKALYGEGFRPPSIFEASYSDAVDQINNPSLKSEQIASSELSVTWNATQKVQTQAYAFTSRLRGLIGSATIEDPSQIQGGVTAPSGDQNDLIGALQYQSQGDVKSHGFGLSARAAGRNTRGYVNVAYAVASLGRPDAASTLAGSPSWLASGGLSYRFRALTAGLSAQYVGAQRLDDSRGETFESGDYLHGNLRLAWETHVRIYPVSVILDAQNLFDSSGSIAASPIYTPSEIPIQGRRVSLGFETRF